MNFVLNLHCVFLRHRKFLFVLDTIQTILREKNTINRFVYSSDHNISYCHNLDQLNVSESILTLLLLSSGSSIIHLLLTVAHSCSGSQWSSCARHTHTPRGLFRAQWPLSLMRLSMDCGENTQTSPAMALIYKRWGRFCKSTAMNNNKNNNWR